jgi:hypothetical protein
MREFAVRIAALFIASILLTAAPPALLAEKATDAVMASDHLEARPFDAEADAKAAVDATLARAKAQNRLAIIVMGACSIRKAHPHGAMLPAALRMISTAPLPNLPPLKALLL